VKAERETKEINFPSVNPGKEKTKRREKTEMITEKKQREEEIRKEDPRPETKRISRRGKKLI